MNTDGNILKDNEDKDSLLLDRARLAVYQFLSLAVLHPQSESWSCLLETDFQEISQAAVEVMREDPSSTPDAQAPGESTSEALDLAPLLSFIQDPKEQLIDEYDSVFGLLISRECPPYETEYCPQTFSVYRSQQMADIAGYYSAFGLEPSREHPKRADHIVLELEFMAWLIAKRLYALENGEEENAGLCQEAQVNFFRDHFAWWTTAFAMALRRKANGIGDDQDLTSSPKSYLDAVGAFLAAFVPAERGILGISPPTELVAPSSDVEEDSEGCTTCQSSSNPNTE